MTQKIDNVGIRGDLPGYVSDGPIVVTNGAGHRMEPQPAYDTLAVTISGLADAYIAADGRLVVIGDDAMAPGTPWQAGVSAVETGEDDDLVVSGVYDPDQVGSVDGGLLGAFAPVTGDLPDRAVPPA